MYKSKILIFNTNAIKIMWPFNIICNLNVIWTVASTFLIFYCSAKFVTWVLTDIHVPIRDSTKQHNWRSVSMLARPSYCSVCEALMITGLGLFCDCCGVCADKSCIKKADQTLHCKPVTSDKENISHHWVKGNLPVAASCFICEEDCCIEPGLVDYRCCWCQRTVHTTCKDRVENECDLGPWRRLIIPPWVVRVSGSRRGSMRNYRKHVQRVIHPGWPDWMPLIVIANRKSGDNEGDHVLSMFRQVLNPAQVIDLNDKPPIIALQWAPLLANALLYGVSVDTTNENNPNESRNTDSQPQQACRLLVGGGDGTIAWVLNVIQQLGLKPQPALAILPLGTGNDLSRVLGWGKENPSDFDATVVLQHIIDAQPVYLDRWNVDIKSCRHLGLRMPAKSLFMYNYLSIGVDAQVALDFHRTRESKFYLFSSRIFNKLLYLIFGTHQTMVAQCRDLQDHLELYLDGKYIELPSIESIVVMNISSWGAGVPLWSMGSEGVPIQSFDDKKLEVLALYSSFHIAQLQVGLSQPHRIGQANVVEIKLNGTSPIQVDGEPWKQHPAHITITHKNQAVVLEHRE